MKKIIQYLLTVFFFSGMLLSDTTAQQTYTDYTPSYEKWQDSYILDKIEHTEDRTIFHIHFAFKDIKDMVAIFYPPGDDYAWYLKGDEGQKSYALKEIRNLYKSGTFVKRSITKNCYDSHLTGQKGYIIFSCEVHFERLPEDLSSIDLIEGLNKERAPNHFNFFKIQLKPWNHPDLGSKIDNDKRIQQFKKVYKTTAQ